MGYHGYVIGYSCLDYCSDVFVNSLVGWNLVSYHAEWSLPPESIFPSSNIFFSLASLLLVDTFDLNTTGSGQP